eukprot:Gb_05995 [translate_table: standard]
MDYTIQHQRLATRIEGLNEDKLLELYIGDQKEDIRHELRILNPSSISTTIQMAKQIEAKNRVSRRYSGSSNFRESGRPVDSRDVTRGNDSQQPQKITTQELDARRARGLCYKCNSKWTRGHKCEENKLFIIEDCVEEEEEEEEGMMQLPPIEDDEKQEECPTISIHALAGIAAPQTLKVEGYIKKEKVIILIDSRSTHNFISRKLA